MSKSPKEITSALLGFLLLIWIIEAVNWVLGHSLNSLGGIYPRSITGLIGIAFAPLLHGGLFHLFYNSIAFLVLGYSIAQVKGLDKFFMITALGWILGGLGIWVMGAPGTVHVGLSGVVYSYFGYLIIGSFVFRDIALIIPTLIVAFFFGSSMLFGLVPQEEVSWTGHFFGLIGGGVAARFHR